ncbi:MAG: flippase [Pyrinomonadaceae bacterium]|nr:flippase [Pyrinomonadaceae bacterium]
MKSERPARSVNRLGRGLTPERFFISTKGFKKIATSNVNSADADGVTAVIEPQDAVRPELVPPSTAGMTTKVVKGSLWTLAGQVAPLGVSLVATPFTIRLLGAEGYGVLILVGLIPTYLGFADLGMGIASTKFGSEAYAAGDAEKEARTVRTAAVLSLLLSVPFGVAIFVLSGWLATLFNVPAHLHAEASLALKVAAVTFVVNFLNQIFNTPQLDRLRMDLNTFVTSGFRMLGIAATPIVIYLGFGILGAVVVLLIASLATLAGHIYVSGRLLPNLFDLSLDRTIIRPMLKFGGALAIASVAALTVANLEKLILPAFVTVRALAYYTVAFTLASMLTMFAFSMIQSLVPAFSQLQGERNREQMQSLYSRSVRINLVLMLPALVGLAIVAETFFNAWAGPDFGRESIFPFYILLIGLVLNIPAYLPYSVIMAVGRTDIFAKLYFAELAPYIFLVLLLTWYFGIFGAAIAWTIRIGMDAVLQFYLAKKVAGLTWPPDFGVAILTAGSLIVPPFLLHIYFGHLTVVTIGAFLISVILYLLFVWKKILFSDERERIIHRLERLRFSF